VLSSSHWGVFSHRCRRTGRRRTTPDAVHHRYRVTRPAVHEGSLRNGPGRASEGRGGDRFIPVTWQRALDLVSFELMRAIATHGNTRSLAVRMDGRAPDVFITRNPGCRDFSDLWVALVDARDTYSNAAGSVLVKHMVGDSKAVAGSSGWQSIANHTRLVVMFGGIPVRNTQITPGGVGERNTRSWLERTCQPFGFQRRRCIITNRTYIAE
jgi:biotin/methionine sulfoxide reductase